MRDGLVHVVDLAPEVGIVLFAFRDHASLASVACDPSELLLPKAGYPSAPSDKRGGEDRTFNSLNGAHCEMFMQIEVYGTHLCLCLCGDVFLDVARASELLFKRRMQPPVIAAPNKGRTSHLDILREFPSSDANLDPTPTRPCPHFEHNRRSGPFLPLTCIQRDRLVP